MTARDLPLMGQEIKIPPTGRSLARSSPSDQHRHSLRTFDPRRRLIVVTTGRLLREVGLCWISEFAPCASFADILVARSNIGQFALAHLTH